MTTPRILLVDDDESARLTLAVLLEDEGFAVEEAARLAEARERLEAMPSCDLAILDRRLPDGAGTELIDLIRESHPRARIATLSGEADPVPPGLVALELTKGDDPDQTLAAIRGLIRREDPA